MSLMKPNLDDICKNPKLLDSMTLGDMLVAMGLELEVEEVDGTPENNAQLSKLLTRSTFIPKRNKH